MTAPAVVKELVERFDAFKETYLSNKYKEIELRQEFLNPLFEALGWDLFNLKGYADAYKEVIHEDAIKIGGRTKAPDYCFRAGGGQRSFFVEAKKPSVDIGEAISPAYQLRRYAWSAKLPVSILTDFEEFAVYDCRIRPDKNDKASTARVIYLNYTEYVERWDELYGLFSPEAIRKGSLEKFVTSKRVKKGTAEVDKAFLSEIEGWRTELARHLALRNDGLEQRDLNFAVQRIIDRIIFLRICEDRGIEPYGKLESLQNAPNIYRRMRELFQRADDRYNSGLFHFTQEKDRSEPPDELTLDLTVDDKPLQDILGGLYYPESPYEFSVFPVEILGQVYEQFLGKVIRLTKGHQAKVEEKPEVRKAGGVYYTPSYIVDYIVRHTVGKLLIDESVESSEPYSIARSVTNSKITPTQAARLRILDPACGSGSFLLGAYQYLLDWHRDWYINNDFNKYAKGRNPKLYKSYSGDWRLTSAERKRILLNNIYGVDIDEQAVEVTKLSLLLKVLEGESGETVDNQIRLFHERALPDLGDNIKCGNSLIGPDFYNGNQLKLFDDEEQLRVNVFDWRDRKLGFGKIMAAGGFDAVIGNPPWVMAGYYIGSELEYIRQKYFSAEGKFDLYYIFIERGLGLLSEQGRCGMIVPNKFFHTRAGRNLRSHLSSERSIDRIIDFGFEKLFSGATNYSCIILMQKIKNKMLQYTRSLADMSFVESFNVSWNMLDENPWHFSEPQTNTLFQKIQKISVPLVKLTRRFGAGVQTGADKIMIMDKNNAKALKLEKSAFRPILRGRDVRRYYTPQKHKYVLFPYYDKQGEFVICEENNLRKLYPKAYSYLNSQKNKLSKRIWFSKNARQLSGKWYGMMYLDSKWAFSTPHLLTPSLSNKSNFSLGNGYLFVTGTAGVTSVIPKDDCHCILYLLGVLNSSLLSFYATHHSPVFQGAYYKFSAPYLKNLPIRTIDFSDKADKRRHDRMVSLVETMLELNKKVAEMKAGHEKTVVERQIAATDKQIDQLVYELYGLTDAEIAVVEQNI
jgi:hypothetical protein